MEEEKLNNLIYLLRIHHIDSEPLENLIKGYKELEEKLKIVDIMCLVEKDKYEIIRKKDYIEKSKIKEKIEALDDIESEYSKKILNISEEVATFTIFVQEILKQLLQEGDDK